MLIIRTPTEKVDRADTFNDKATARPFVQRLTSTRERREERERERERDRERERERERASVNKHVYILKLTQS